MQRPFSSVPFFITFITAITFSLQIYTHFQTPRITTYSKNLTQPPSYRLLKAISLGEPITLAKLLMLHLQAFDNQPGVSIPFRSLDYRILIEWLDVILKLDPNGQYPLLAASRLYAEVPDPFKQRMMLNFVYEKFLEDPNKRWPWLAHASLIARHQLKDIQLSRTYTQALREKITSSTVPHWVTQMDALLAEDMNELDSAKILIGGLLTSGKITDPHEFHFLQQKLEQLGRKSP